MGRVAAKAGEEGERVRVTGLDGDHRAGETLGNHADAMSLPRPVLIERLRLGSSCRRQRPSIIPSQRREHLVRTLRRLEGKILVAQPAIRIPLTPHPMSLSHETLPFDQ